MAKGRLKMPAEHPLPLSNGYYFVYPHRARNPQLLAAFRDFIVEAARPFRE